MAPTASADGYGCSAEALILSAVKDHGADIAFIEHDWRDSRFSDPEFLDLRVNDHPMYYRDILLVYFLPFALGKFRSRQTISMTMWETDRLPDSWAACLYMSNGVIVPSRHCQEVFSPRVPVPVEVVPFGTNTDFYSLGPKRQEGPTRFLMSGLLHYRKGVEFALKALRQEFGDDPGVQLTLKTRNGFLDVGKEWAMLDDPRVTVIDTSPQGVDYTREQMRALYWSHDCLLAPSRGEGSGLTPRDAMACGLPVILTNWSGLSEIADPRYSYPVDVEELEPAPPDCSSYAPGITGGGNIGNFARPSVVQLREAMREVHENPTGARMRGLAAADWMRRDFTWTKCAGQWLAALERLTVRYV